MCNCWCIVLSIIGGVCGGVNGSIFVSMVLLITTKIPLSLSLSPSKYTYEIPRSERIVFTLRTNLSRSGKTARSRLSCTSIRTDGCLLLLRQGEEERETKGREKKRQREDRGLRFTLFRVLPGWKGEVRKEGKKMKKTTLARESARY